MRSKVRVLAHPVHPLIVSYPIAFYTATLLAAVVFAFSDDPFCPCHGSRFGPGGEVLQGPATRPLAPVEDQ